MYITLILFLALFVLIGIYAGKNFKHNDADGYFMADRALNKWQIGISAGATANSGFIVVGAVGMGYGMGLSSMLYPLAWLLGDIIFWFFFAERIRNKKSISHAITVPEALESNGTNRTLRVFSALVVLVLLMVYAASQFIASVKVVSAFTDVSATLALGLSFVFVVAYSVWGGFKSSVWTDIAQGIMMILLTLGMILWGIVEVGGISALMEGISAQGSKYTDLFGGRSLWALLVFVLGFAFTGFGFSMSQPQVTTRIFAASSPQAVKDSKWIYMAFLHFTWIGMCLIGIIAKLLMPEIQDAEIALPMMAKTYFPDYIIGAVFAAMIATILSSVDSLMVASASAATVDFGLDKKVSEEKKIFLYRASIVVIGLLTLLMSIFMEATVFSAALFAATVLTASIGSAMVLIVLNLTKSSNTVLIAVSVGFFTAILWKVLGYDSVVNDGLVGFVFALVVSLGYEKIFNRAR